MDFADSPEHAAFRAEFRHWLEINLPPEICVDDAADQRVAPDRETLEKRIAWQKRMHAAGWVGISWPKEYGGRGADFMQQVIFDEEYFRARAPILPTASALNLLGPTLIHWGTEEQKKRHLPRILSADALWCQGYSEPDAGGDLASLRTRAVNHGDHAAQIARLGELAKQFPNRQEPAWNESHIRQQLAQLAIDVKALQVTRLRGLTRRLRGEPPGPEGSILKLFGSELALRIADFSSTLLGPYATVDAPTEAVPDAARWHHRVLGARQYTIAGGTSEIQRNIIGERVLGLPKG